MFWVDVSTPGGQAALLDRLIQGPMFFPSGCPAVLRVLSCGGSWVSVGSCWWQEKGTGKAPPHIPFCWPRRLGKYGLATCPG